MKKILFMLCTAGMLCITPSAKAQFVVTDPMNLAQGIVNSVKEVIQMSTAANNVMKNFKEVEKVYNQGKQYYDKLQAVNNLVKDARKVQQTVLLVGEISDMYVQNYGKMINDPNFTIREKITIGKGYSKLLNESTYLLQDLKQLVTPSSLSLNDKERMELIDKLYKEIKEYHSLVRYYTNKNISVSLLRSKKHNNAQRVLDLYGTNNQKYW